MGTTCDSAGRYAFAKLRAGILLELEASAPGFAHATGQVTLSPAGRTHLDLALKSVPTTPTASGSPDVLDRTSDTSDFVVRPEQVASVPSIGRKDLDRALQSCRSRREPRELVGVPRAWQYARSEPRDMGRLHAVPVPPSVRRIQRVQHGRWFRTRGFPKRHLTRPTAADWVARCDSRADPGRAPDQTGSSTSVRSARVRSSDTPLGDHVLSRCRTTVVPQAVLRRSHRPRRRRRKPIGAQSARALQRWGVPAYSDLLVRRSERQAFPRADRQKPIVAEACTMAARTSTTRATCSSCRHRAPTSPSRPTPALPADALVDASDIEHWTGRGMSAVWTRA